MISGKFEYGYWANRGHWTLDQGTGERSARFHIDFPAQAFEYSDPNVLVALNGLDSANTTNLRVVVVAENVTREGFDVLVRTWADSVIYTIWGSYLAG